MAAPARTVLVTRSAISVDAMAWQAKLQQDSGVYAVDIRPLLKAEKISLGSFVVLPIRGLSVATNSQVGGLLLLTISGGDPGISRLQFVFSDTGGDIEVFQVSLPVSGAANCCPPVSSSGGRAVRGPPGPAGSPGTPGRPGATGPAGPPGLLDGASLQPLPNELLTSDEVVIYRPGVGFFFVPASRVADGVASDVVFAGQPVTWGDQPVVYGTTPVGGPVTFAGQDVTFAGQPVTFGTVRSAGAVTFAGQDVTFAGQPVTFGTTGSAGAVDFAGQPVTYAGQPVTYTTTSAATGEYTFVQSAPALTWTIQHNLNLHPAVRAVNTDSDLVDAEVHYSDRNQVVLTFPTPFAGTAYL